MASGQTIGARRNCLASGLLALVAVSALADEDFAWKKGEYKVMENAQFRIAFVPTGGRAMSIYSKAIGQELTDPAGIGCFAEQCWDRPKSREFLMKKPYEMIYRTGDGGLIDVTAVGNAQGGDINFLKVERRMTSSDDSTALRVDYRFENMPDAMSLVNYALLVHASLGIRGRDVNCYYPLLEGIKKVPHHGRPNEYWLQGASRGWMANATDDGIGVAVTMPFRDVHAFYSWYTQLPTMEWRMIPIGLECGRHYDVSTEVIPFKGLKTVSGAGGGLVGEIADGVCRVVSSRAGNVVAQADGVKTELSFAKPGDLCEFKTAARQVVLSKDGKPVCWLDAAPATGDWSIEPLENQRVSSVKEPDLCCYTNFAATGAYAWGKPLKDRPLRLAAVTGLGTQLEVGWLAERFDLDYRTTGVNIAGGAGARSVANPVYSNGDYFGLISAGDVENAAKKVLAWGEAEVMLLGGVPPDVLPASLRKLVFARVKSGTGLVILGADRDIPELGLRRQKLPPRRRAAKAVDETYSEVPFRLLGEESVNAFETDGWTVLATAGDRPYLMEKTLGKGRVVLVNYQAAADIWGRNPLPGLTPNLMDFYPDRVSPYEHYYSLVAKALLRAAGRKSPIAFTKGVVTADTAAFDVRVAEKGASEWSWRALSPFGEVLASGKRTVELDGGDQQVTLSGLAIPPFAGRLSFDVVVRQDGKVANWGAWEFALPLKADIVDVKLDERYHREGDVVKVEVKGNGIGDPESGCRLRMRVVDSYGREVCRDFAGTAWSFKVENALPARCYDVIAELVDAKGAVVARRKAELRVRPAREKLVWDDFEVGTWANANVRRYQWPELAKAFHASGVDTVIANPYPAEIDLPCRYNIHPTCLSDAGLSRCAEPDAYSKTGDKMKLVRRVCLSSPEFFAGRDKALAAMEKDLPRYGIRYVWFGDEQSITGYGGNPVDFCFSEHCLKAMREFVKGKYGTLEKLNEEWETSFASWDDVVPFTRQEVWNAKGRHVAGWADHLEFMDDRLTNSVAYSCRRLHKADPDMRFSLSGTQPPNAYGGTDYWKILGVLDSALSYGSGGQHDIHRSFSPNGAFTPWSWGYNNAGGRAVAACWRPLFYGCRGLMGFCQSSQWNPDLTYSQGLKDTVDHVNRLRHGVGKHVVNNLRTRPDVAILYSQASFRAAFIENRRKEHEGAEEKVRRLLMNLGYSYDYVSGVQLASGVVSARGYKVLYLADAAALGDDEIAGILAFAKQGVVVADGLPGRLRQNCRARQMSPLKDFFGQGKGLLFADLTDRDHIRFEAALGKAGVTVDRLTVKGADGTRFDDLDVFAKVDGAGNPFWGVLVPEGEPRKATVIFPRKGWVYDLVSGRAYGYVDRIERELSIGTPCAFVLMPEEMGIKEVSVWGMTVSVSCKTAADTVVRVRVYRPDGTEAECYAKNLLAKGGLAEMTVPFALSDPSGVWTLRAEEVVSGDVRTSKMDFEASRK